MANGVVPAPKSKLAVKREKTEAAMRKKQYEEMHRFVAEKQKAEAMKTAAVGDSNGPGTSEDVDMPDYTGPPEDTTMTGLAEDATPSRAGAPQAVQPNGSFKTRKVVKSSHIRFRDNMLAVTGSPKSGRGTLTFADAADNENSFAGGIPIIDDTGGSSAGAAGASRNPSGHLKGSSPVPSVAALSEHDNKDAVQPGQLPLLLRRDRDHSYNSANMRSIHDLISDGSDALTSGHIPELLVPRLAPVTTTSAAFHGSSARISHLPFPGANSNIWNNVAPPRFPAAANYNGNVPQLGRMNSGDGSDKFDVGRPAFHSTFEEPTMKPNAETRSDSMNQDSIYVGMNSLTIHNRGFGEPENQHGAVGTRLNASAAEFETFYEPSKHVILHPLQQVNWRYLLEPGVTADWDLVCDKIVNNNDQQASIFLQQKIKNSDANLKDDIVESITHRGLELMGNRFGNFLIQRVFECANHDQTMGLAAQIKNHTVRLSTDAFGCHVIQKAFDHVPEDFKHIMVHELLAAIRTTIVHRYACHVWQKLFELRWQGPPPVIMGTVNAALIGQWVQVAVGETGSLVVQNIFENCNDDDKRPAVTEVLANLEYVARGQFGNWCIQHICEHGTPADRETAINMLLARAAEYSRDQYASKCIEKCLKVCGPDFLTRYLEQVLFKHANEKASPLVQIARDQYGNFLVQWILNNAPPHVRDVVEADLRGHIVSLRGNKYGSKVALSCRNNENTVHPGPPSVGYQTRRPLPGHSSGFRGGYNSSPSYRHGLGYNQGGSYHQGNGHYQGGGNSGNPGYSQFNAAYSDHHTGRVVPPYGPTTPSYGPPGNRRFGPLYQYRDRGVDQQPW